MRLLGCLVLGGKEEEWHFHLRRHEALPVGASTTPLPSSDASVSRIISFYFGPSTAASCLNIAGAHFKSADAVNLYNAIKRLPPRTVK